MAAIVRAAPGAPPRGEQVRLVGFGVGDRPLRLTGAERLLTGLGLEPASAGRAGAAAGADCDPPDDVHGSADYRRHLATVLTERALLGGPFAPRAWAPMTAPSDRIAVRGTVNGRPAEHVVEARRSLADFLREDLGLTGAHVGCEHGVCEACTVLVDGRRVRSCLLLAAQLEGASVTTIEGLTPPRVCCGSACCGEGAPCPRHHLLPRSMS